MLCRPRRCPAVLRPLHRLPVLRMCSGSGGGGAASALPVAAASAKGSCAAATGSSGVGGPGGVGLSAESRRMVEQLLGGHRASLSRAITLVESTRPQDGVQARLLIDELHRALTTRSAEPRGRQQEGVAPIVGAFRLGLCGPPGVGKSTLIEALGCWLLDEEARGVAHRVAVIAVDPSSVLSGGSILGDKTRMVTLASHPRAFVRPSPTRGVLGGVARRTEEVLFLCEAAGYDVVLVETVGVGQSETAVSAFVDMTALVLPPGGGDGLQGIKRGVMELADCVVVNKADGEMATAAAATRAEYAGVLQLMRPRHVGWRAPALLASAASFPPRGLEELWECVGEFRDCLSQQHGAALGRREQRLAWLWGAVGELAVEAARGRPEATALAEAAASGQMSPTVAAAQIVHGVLEVSPAPMDID